MTQEQIDAYEKILRKWENLNVEEKELRTIVDQLEKLKKIPAGSNICFYNEKGEYLTDPPFIFLKGEESVTLIREALTTGVRDRLQRVIKEKEDLDYGKEQSE